MSHPNDLDPWRQGIREIDAKILQLLAERMELSLKIGSYKQQHNLPVKDFAIEKQIIEKSRIEAVRLGLYPALAEDLMSTIIRYSVLRQDELKREAIAQPLGKGQEALILGGAGQMGQWFAQFYESLGFAVSIFDLINPSKNQYPRVHDLARELNRFDLLVLASPMPATIHLIEFLIAEKARGLIIEICSLKSPIQKSIRDAVAAGLKIASIHPMFGPDTDLLAGKNIIFCTDPGLHSETILKQHFQQTSAQLICLPFDEHDKHMSYVLGSAHLMNLMYASILAQSGETLQSLQKVGGTTFIQQSLVTRKVVAENKDLYYDIQTLNHETPELLVQFKTVLDKYSAAIAKADRNEFRELMGRAQDFFKNE